MEIRVLRDSRSSVRCSFEAAMASPLAAPQGSPVRSKRAKPTVHLSLKKQRSDSMEEVRQAVPRAPDCARDRADAAPPASLRSVPAPTATLLRWSPW